MRELDVLDDLVGTEVAVTSWMTIGQPRIDTFAEATSDHQWIHTDPARCALESPFGATVAHGFLTLALLPAMFEDAIKLVGVTMVLNYGLNKVRFPAPVPVDSRVRGRLTLLKVEPVEGAGTCDQLTWAVVVECEGQPRPVCVAEMLMRRYR